jgi:hypothetical protein
MALTRNVFCELRKFSLCKSRLFLDMVTLRSQWFGNKVLLYADAQ